MSAKEACQWDSVSESATLDVRIGQSMRGAFEKDRGVEFAALRVFKCGGRNDEIGFCHGRGRIV